MTMVDRVQEPDREANKSSLRRLGIVGAGTMGRGIAWMAARAGFTVIAVDVDEKARQALLDHARARAERAVGRGELSLEAAEAALRRLSAHEAPEALADSEAVIEAVYEAPDVKRSVFAAVEAAVDPATLLLTNTSSLSVTEIAAGLRRPERLVGMHFFNPADVMPLVEIVRAAQSDPAAVATAVSLAESLGKTPIVVRDTPGFVVNRVARAYYNESLRLIEWGQGKPEAIDALFEARGFKMGPFALQDLIGLDVNFATTSTVFAQTFYEPRFRPSLLQKAYVFAGRLGRKRGRGFYRYDDR
ncbi:3-hydroxyacyl-CoA dehydrogenase family protein [Hydrogenibacillus schlegelii]|nr:3-hydroxyacyl-CoA dehydrogenase NAD-binding domain-containing protein [Hydrogenibacillus schlegelii]